MNIDAPTCGRQLAQIQGAALRRADLHAQVGRTGVEQFDTATRRQHDLAARRLDQPLIAKARADQHDAPAQRRAQLALVDDVRVTRATEQVAPRAPVLVSKVQGRHHQPSHIDPGARAEQHAMRVQQPDLAVAAQASQQLRRIVAHHPVQDLAAGSGLIEAHRTLRTDRKRVPVQHRTG